MPPYECYVEGFGGAGWVLFEKNKSKKEVFNDRNSLLFNLYRCVREKPDGLCDKLRYWPCSRDEFDRILRLHADERHTRLTADCNTGLASEFYYLIRNSYASGLTSFSCQPHDFWKDFPLIHAASRRLANVVIENQDFEVLIHHYDRPDTFFYMDPPYFGTEDLYQNIGKEGFGMQDHLRLRDALLGIEGHFLLSYNKDPFIYDLYDRPGIHIVEVDRLHNFRQRFDAGAMYEEYLIANYDLEAVRNNKIVQLNIFDQMGTSELLIQ